MTEYINSKSKLEELEKEVVQGTQSLEKSLLDLKELAKEVQANLEKAKNPNKDNKSTTITAVVEEKEISSEVDKQIEVSSNCSDQVKFKEQFYLKNILSSLTTRPKSKKLCKIYSFLGFHGIYTYTIF